MKRYHFTAVSMYLLSPPCKMTNVSVETLVRKIKSPHVSTLGGNRKSNCEQRTKNFGGTAASDQCGLIKPCTALKLMVLFRLTMTCTESWFGLLTMSGIPTVSISWNQQSGPLLILSSWLPSLMLMPLVLESASGFQVNILAINAPKARELPRMRFPSLKQLRSVQLSIFPATSSRLHVLSSTLTIPTHSTFQHPLYTSPLQSHPHLCNEHPSWQWSLSPSIPYLRQKIISLQTLYPDSITTLWFN